MIKRPTYDISAQFAEVWKQYVKSDSYVYDKRPNTETYHLKTTCIHEERPDQKRQTTKCQDTLSKEICVYEKRPNTETYAYNMSHMCDMCDRRRNSTHSLVCQKRPVYLERDLIQRPMRMTCLTCVTCVTEEETHAWNQHTRCCCMRTVRQIRFVYIKRGVVRRPTYTKRDVYMWKETWSKRPACMSCMTCYCGMQTVYQKRHLRIKREIVKRPTYGRRDLHMIKETCIYGKRPGQKDLHVWHVWHER